MVKLALSVLAAAWWISVGAGALYFMTYKATPAPAAKAVVNQTPRIQGIKEISPTEDVRAIWMPSSIENIGSRCLLYTNKETHAAAITCNGTEVNFE